MDQFCHLIRMECEMNEKKQVYEQELFACKEDYDDLQDLFYEEQYQKCISRKRNQELQYNLKQFKKRYHKLLFNKTKINQESNNKCLICYESIGQYPFICENNKCNKKFHMSCILQLESSKLNTCPYCKTNYKSYNFVIPECIDLYQHIINYYGDKEIENKPILHWCSWFYNNHLDSHVFTIQSWYRKNKKKKVEKDIEKRYRYYLDNSSGVNRNFSVDV